MKLFIVLVAVLGVSTAATLPAGKALDRQARDLTDDWNDFYALIPTDEIRAIVSAYLAEDAEVQAAVEWLKSQDYADMLTKFVTNESVIALGDHLRDAGVDVDKYVAIVRNWLGFTRSTSRAVSTRITGGVAGLVADIKEVLPLAELRALFNEKLETSSDFASLVNFMTSDKAIEFFSAIRATEEYQTMLATAEAYGLNFEKLRSLVKAFLGWE